jgi:hypothetical protein
MSRRTQSACAKQEKEHVMMDGLNRLAFGVAAVVTAVAAGFAMGPVAWDVPPGNEPKATNQDVPTHTETLDPVIDLSVLDKVGSACWSELRTKRIYFSHQAIGSEIIAGLHEAMRRKPDARLSVTAYAEPDTSEGTTTTVFDEPALVEGPAGRRGDPARKIDEFEKFLRSNEGAKIDIAVLKLCYGDITRTTDADALIDRYAKAVDTLRRERPNIHLIHCTIPLKATDEGTRGRMKRLVGAGSDASNAVRAKYNDAIRTRFPAETLFDIAAVESRRADGSTATVEYNGKRVQVLAGEYTDDGAHLNRLGQLIAAREFLVTLGHQCSAGARERAVTTAGDSK